MKFTLTTCDGITELLDTGSYLLGRPVDTPVLLDVVADETVAEGKTPELTSSSRIIGAILLET